MKTLDQIIINFDGVWNFKFDELVAYEVTQPPKRLLISKQEFQQRAKELGFVGKYRWGVEYKTDGKQPELAGDVVVSAESKLYKIGELSDAESVKWSWKVCVKFKITDQRYKPADTSYLNKLTVVGFDMAEGKDQTVEHLHNPDNSSDWYGYDNQKALRLPPVGVQVIGFIGTGFKLLNLFYVGKNSRGSLVVEDESGEFKCFHEHQINFKPLDHDRKAKAERKRVVDAALASATAAEALSKRQLLESIYDKGFLRLPD